jgi:hypothetical protein
VKERKRFVFALACVLLMDGVPAAAFAEPNDLGNTIIQGIVGLFSRASAISHAKDAWLQIDASTQECVAQKSGAQPHDLMNNGIGPDDARVGPYIEACRQEAAQAAAREAQSAADRTTSAGGARKVRRRARPTVAATAPAQKANHRDPVSSSGAVAASVVQSGQIRIGMTRDQVSAARGAPARKEAVPPDYELWHYAAGDIAFTNGRVSYIGH